MAHTPSDNQITFFALTDFRGKGTPFGIRRRDRRFHTYLLGRSGAGKSSLMETMLRQDMERGDGLLLLDPHGDLATGVVGSLPPHRQHDLVHFDAGDPETPVRINPVEHVPALLQPLAASGVMSAFKTVWADSWGPRLEHILRNAALALIARHGSTLADIPRLFDDKGFRSEVVEGLENEQVKRFWLSEYERYPERFRGEAVAPVQNKVGAFLADPTLCRILTGEGETLRLRRIMDEGRIVVVNLAKGRIGDEAVRLLGALLLSRVTLAALSRVNLPQARRRDFYVYADEVHSYATTDLAGMLAELRKFRLSAIVGSQHLSQLQPQVQDTLLGNVGTLIAFRLGVKDAETLAGEFLPNVTPQDLVSLPNHHIYLRLMIDGRVSDAFSARTLLPHSVPAART